jgi:hypothetical protein
MRRFRHRGYPGGSASGKFQQIALWATDTPLVESLERDTIRKNIGHYLHAELERRLRALEQRMPDPTKVSKTLVPDWLMAAWLEMGLHFDPFDEASLLRALRAQDPGLRTL